MFEDEDASAEIRALLVALAHHGMRLDRMLAQSALEFSRSYLQQLIEAGLVLINGAVIRKTSTRVKAGDHIAIELRPTAQSQAFTPQAMELDVVYEDDALLVINKPAGLVVHPAPGNWSGTLLNGLLARHTQMALVPRAGIVHRLDKDTSGLMVVARTRAVMDSLVKAIAAREVSRQYLAIGQGAWSGVRRKTVDAPIGRDPRNRLRMAVVDLQVNAGKTAKTDIVLLQTTPAACLVRCILHTGRTHQIRVHMASIGHPLVADLVYGGKPHPNMQRQALHATHLAFLHPISGARMRFDAPIPQDFDELGAALGLRYNSAQWAESP